jgi:hypothetical protein
MTNEGVPYQSMLLVMLAQKVREALRLQPRREGQHNLVSSIPTSVMGGVLIVSESGFD